MASTSPSSTHTQLYNSTCNTHTQAGLEDAERSKVERQVEAEHCLKAQVKSWQGKLADIKKEMVSRTKERDKEAKELQKAEVILSVRPLETVSVPLLLYFTSEHSELLHLSIYVRSYICCTRFCCVLVCCLSPQSSKWRMMDTLKSKQNLLEENAKTLSHLEAK